MCSLRVWLCKAIAVVTDRAPTTAVRPAEIRPRLRSRLVSFLALFASVVLLFWYVLRILIDGRR